VPTAFQSRPGIDVEVGRGAGVEVGSEAGGGGTEGDTAAVGLGSIDATKLVGVGLGGVGGRPAQATTASAAISLAAVCGHGCAVTPI
jgi:hypothetical protein